MKKRKILPWLLVGALGIGAYFGLKQCSDETPKDKPKIVRKVKRPRRHIPRQSHIDFRKIFLENLRKPEDRSVHNIYEKSLVICFDENDWLRNGRIMQLGEDYEAALSLYEDNKDYYKAAMMAIKMQDLKKAKELLLKGQAHGNFLYPWPYDFKDEKLRKDDHPASIMRDMDRFAKKLAELGEYDLAMKIYEDSMSHEHSNSSRLSVKLALKHGDIKKAREIFDNMTIIISQDPAGDLERYKILFFNPLIHKELGSLDDYRQQCNALEDWIEDNFDEVLKAHNAVKNMQGLHLNPKNGKPSYSAFRRLMLYERCKERLLQAEGRYEELAEFYVASLLDRSAIKALALAHQHGFDAPDFDWDIEDEVRTKAKKSRLAGEEVDHLIDLGYDQNLIDIFRRNNDTVGLEAILKIEKKRGNHEAVLDTYQEMLDNGKFSASIDAAKYARKIGKRNDEEYFLKRFLKEKDNFRGKYSQTSMDAFTAYALARLGDEKGAMAVCQRMPKSKCECAEKVMLALYGK